MPNDKYQKDIKRLITNTLDITPKQLNSLVELITLTNQFIHDDKDLNRDLSLLEDLSELDVQDNACMAYCLDKLIDKIEKYESTKNLTPNQKLVILMKQTKTKQKELSHIVPQSIISELVNGKRQLTIRHIKEFAQYFKVDPSFFINT